MNPTPIKPFTRLLRLLQTDRKDIIRIYVYSVFIGLLSLSLPMGIQAIIHFIQMGQVSTSWFILVLLVVSAILIGGILQIYQLRLTEHLQQKIFIRSSFEFTYRIPRFRFESLRNQYAPELINRFFDTMTVQKGLPKLLIDFSAALLQLFFGLVLLSIYHPFFILFSLILLIVLAVMLYYSGKRGLSTSISESKYKYKVAFWLEELARTMNTFKLAGQSELPLQKTNEFTEAYIRERENHFKVLYFQFAQLIGFKTLTAFFLLLIGGMLVLSQQMNIGQFVAAELIILLVIGSVEKIILNFENLYDVLTALDKLGQVTDIEIEQEENKRVQELKPGPIALDIRNLDFRYSTENRFIFKDFNLQIGAGQHTAIIGSDGAGKTTLLHLIAQLFMPENGSIAYSNTLTSELNLEMLRTHIGDYLSDQQLFLGNLEENITMGRADIQISEVIDACEKVQLIDWVHDQKDGLNTTIDPNGMTFSRSLKQKIIMARCIVNHPQLLLMDDQQRFTSSSLKNSDHLIDLLLSDSAPWTFIAATKNDLWLPHFKQIIVLKAGNIEFAGTYQAWLKAYPSNTSK